MSHPTDCRSRGSNLVYKASGLSTTPQRLLFTRIRLIVLDQLVWVYDDWIDTINWMAVLKNKTDLYKAITPALTLTCRKLSTYTGRHMAVTPFNSPAFCQNSQDIRDQGSGRSYFKQFSSDTAGYSKSRFELYFGKNASNKIIFQIFAFLIIATGLYYQFSNIFQCSVSR